MGLGLAMVKNIILNSGGQVWFESGKNKAPHFFLSLPMYLQANR
jgi:signal transduction histidine kinase